MIKYDSALDSLGQIVHIKNIIREEGGTKEKYSCIDCGQELIPRLGQKNERHFAHKEDVACSGETYLHKLCKLTFFNVYQKCLKEKRAFNIELNQNQTCTKCESELNMVCDLGEKLILVDLTKKYDKVFLERKDGEFTPDITLISKDCRDKIFIEIAVSHKSTDKKLNSDNKIIELRVDDPIYAEFIENCELSMNHPDITFHNFKVKKFEGVVFENYCDIKYHFFFVLGDGSCSLRQLNLLQIKSYLKKAKENIVKYYIADHYENYSSVYKFLIANAHKENVYVRNCFICKYQDKDRYDYDAKKPIFCFYLRKKHNNSNEAAKCNSNEALTCVVFKPSIDNIEELYNRFQYIKPRSFQNS